MHFFKLFSLFAFLFSSSVFAVTWKIELPASGPGFEGGVLILNAEETESGGTLKVSHRSTAQLPLGIQNSEGPATWRNLDIRPVELIFDFQLSFQRGENSHYPLLASAEVKGRVDGKPFDFQPSFAAMRELVLGAADENPEMINSLMPDGYGELLDAFRQMPVNSGPDLRPAILVLRKSLEVSKRMLATRQDWGVLGKSLFESFMGTLDGVYSQFLENRWELGEDQERYTATFFPKPLAFGLNTVIDWGRNCVTLDSPSCDMRWAVDADAPMQAPALVVETLINAAKKLAASPAALELVNRPVMDSSPLPFTQSDLAYAIGNAFLECAHLLRKNGK